MKEEVRYARQLFLFGDGSGSPIKNTDRLAKEAGCSVRTLRDWLPKWRKEAEELALSSKNSPFSLELSSAALTQHREEIDFLSTQVEKLRKRLKKTRTNDPSYPTYLSAYKMALDKWEKSSGISGQYDVALASMKESARARARVEARREYEQAGPMEPRRLNDSRFDLD